MTKFNRIHLVVLDSVGIGAAPDADKFFNNGENDSNSDTLGNISKTSGLNVPNMEKLGLGNIPREEALTTVKKVDNPIGYATKLEEVSLGKDTMTGHWEIMGLNIQEPFDTFFEGFPEELLVKIEEFSGRKIIREANKPYSGTAVIDDFGARQMETGELIVYTSADPVLQIAAHEEVIPLDELYKICEFAREITKERPQLLGRIIARPYVGKPGSFQRTSNRHDYALNPFSKTVLDNLKEAGISTYAVGKINDIFNGAGISHDLGHNKDNNHGVDNLLVALKDESFVKGLSFTNLVDFDAVYGHRRNSDGYRDCLEEFDARIPEIIDNMKEDDLLLITADHGNDPTYYGTDHTREYVPLLVYSKSFNGSGLLPVGYFADISATIADNFGVSKSQIGESFLDKLQ